MSTERMVRTALAARAAVVPTEPLSGPALRIEAAVRHRRTVRTGFVAGAVAVAVAAVLLVVPTVANRNSLPPASTQVDTWPARGDLAHDVALATAAKRAWEAAPAYRAELPHHDVRVLLATRTAWGRYVVLTGFNALGHRRLAVFSDDPRDHAPYRTRLRLRSDRAFPRESLVTDASERKDEVLVLAAGPPDATALRWRIGSGTPWHDLPAVEGAAATVVPLGTTNIEIRAYRGSRRIAQGHDYSGRYHLYEADESLARPAPDGRAPESCHGGVCQVQAGGSFAVATPTSPGTLAGPGTGPDDPWHDMTDQAEQLWLNYIAPPLGVRSWGGSGEGLSTLLPDGTGLFLSRRYANSDAERLVLYVDRPEWPIGRLYLAKPYTDDVKAVSAIVPGADGPVLVVFAVEGATVRYRSNGWHAVPVRDSIGYVALPRGTTTVDVEVTVAGGTTTAAPDTTAALPLP